MRPYFVPALILLLGSVAAPAEPPRLRILSYNIHHGEGTDGNLDLKRIARIINDARPDLVALQEVDVKTARVGGIDEAAQLAKLTDLRLVRGDVIDHAGGRYGNAALVRGTVIAHKNHLLPPSSREQRGVLDIRLRTEIGSPTIRLLATHLDHRGPNKERLASAAFINKLVKEDATPAILAGDLNDTPQSATLNTFARQWHNPTGAKTLLTSPAGQPARQIDYVLCRPAGDWKLIKAKVLGEPVASDHRPLLVVLEFRGER